MKKIFLTFFSAFCTFLLKAQDDGSQVEIALDNNNNSWYASPWVWVAGAALVIVLLVLLSRGKENKV